MPSDHPGADEPRPAPLAAGIMVVAELSTVLSTLTTIPDLARVLQGRLKWLMPVQRVSLCLLDEDGLTYRVITAEGDITRWSTQDGLIGWVLRHDVQLDIPDLQSDSCPVGTARVQVEGDTGALLVLPLRGQGRLLGALAVHSSSVGAFVAVDRGLLGLLTLQVAATIHTADLVAQLERERYGERERFRSAFTYAAIGMALVGLDSRWIQANRSLCQVVGYSEQELQARTFHDITSPADLESDLSQLRQLVAGTIRSYQMEKRYIHKQGHLVWVLLTVSLVRDAEGAPQYLIFQVQDITDRKRLEEQLEYRALHDPLTHLPNRTLLHDRLDQAIRTARRNQIAFALLLFDIDRFKDINDTFGHACGDVVLRDFGSRVRTATRDPDTLARLGGDEFALLLPDADETAALAVADKILKALAHPFEIEGQLFHLDSSIGIALYPDHAADAESLLRLADVAMYAAKEMERTVAVYEPNCDQHTPLRLALMNQLRLALDCQELTLHFQPQVDLASGRVEGVEALVRWEHSDRGFIPPDQFIPWAEHAGLMVPLGRFVLNEALRQCRAWQDEGLYLSVAINLSARNLRDPDLITVVADLLACWGIDSRWLVIELTESVVMKDSLSTMQTLEALRGMGVRLALDDFGTGYSSLAYLQHLPVSEIKIDQSFVRHMTANENDRRIVHAMVSLSHDLGLQTTAEGVEDRDSLDVLTSFGCDRAQGYLFSRPLPADACRAWLRSRR